MCGYLCNYSYLWKLCINRVIIQNTVNPRLCNYTSEIMQWHPWTTHQHQQPYRHGDETVPQIAASAPNENQMLQAPHMKYLEGDENDLIFLCTHNGKIGYRWLLSESCNISGGWDGRSVRIISSSLHVNCNDCTMTKNPTGDELCLTSVGFCHDHLALYQWNCTCGWLQYSESLPERERRIIIHPLLFFVLLFWGGHNWVKSQNTQIPSSLFYFNFHQRHVSIFLSLPF